MTGCQSSGSVRTTSSDQARAASVTRVIDGDTIEVRSSEGQITVRLAGINAPESDECFGDIAGEELRGAIEGTSVVLEPVGVDQFERLLAHVFVAGAHVNLDLVQRGLAIATSSADGAHRATLIEAEGDAYAEEAGLWAPEACGTGGSPVVDFDTERSEVDPPGRDEEKLEEEHVVIVNHGTTPLSLGGWTLRDESSLHRLSFGDDARIGAGGSLTVSSNDSRWSPGGSPVWNNEGDMALLQDALGNVISRWRY